MANLTINALVKGATNEFNEELLSNPFQVLKQINKQSKDSEKYPRTAELFERAGIPAGKLTFGAFAPFTYDYCEFGGVSSAEWVSFSGYGSANMMHPRCTTPFIMRVHNGVICGGSRLLSRPWGDTGLTEVVVVGTDPLPLSVAAYLGCLGIIANRAKAENKAREKAMKRAERLNKKIEKAWKKRLSALGSVSLSPSVMAQLRANVVAEVTANFK